MLILGISIGISLGGVVTIFTLSLLTVSKKSDEYANRLLGIAKILEVIKSDRLTTKEKNELTEIMEILKN